MTLEVEVVRARCIGTKACVNAAPGTFAMDRPPPDAKKLLAFWMEWEKGETPPGRVMSNLKTAGMRELLDELASVVAAAEPTDAAPS